MDTRIHSEQTTLGNQEQPINSTILFKATHGNFVEIDCFNDLVDPPGYPEYPDCEIFIKIQYPEHVDSSRKEDTIQLTRQRGGEYSLSLDNHSLFNYIEPTPAELTILLKALQKYPKISEIRLRFTKASQLLNELLEVTANSLKDNRLSITSIAIELCTALLQNPIIEHSRTHGLKALADALKTNTNLRAVTMTCSQSSGINDADIVILAEGLLRHQSIEELNFGNNRIGNKGAAAIAKILSQSTVLRSIELYGNFIRDEGAKKIFAELRNNNTLISLNLSRNDFSISALEPLNTCQNRSLQVLNLSCNPIFSMLRYEGEIYEAYPHCISAETPNNQCIIIGKCYTTNGLMILDLNSNKVYSVTTQSKEATYLHTHSEVISKNYSIIINESNNSVFYFDKEKHELIQSPNQNNDNQIDELRKIEFYKRREMNVAHFIRKHALVEYFTPYVFDNTTFPDNIFAFCKNFSALQKLGLANCGLMDLAAQVLAKAIEGNHHLRELDLANNSIRNKGAIAIAETLIKENNTLEILNLTDNGIEKDGATALISANSLNVLLLSKNYGIHIRQKPLHDGSYWRYHEVNNDIRSYCTKINTKTFIDLEHDRYLNDHFDYASNEYDPNRNKDGSVTTKMPSLKQMSLFAVKKHLMIKAGSVTVIKNEDGSIKVSYINAKTNKTELLPKAIPAPLALALNKKMI